MSKRALLISQGLVLLSLGLGAVVAPSMTTYYTGGPIVIRSWLAMVSGVIAGATGLSLLLGATQLWPRARWAALLWALGGALAAAHATLGFAWADTPLAHGSALVLGLTALTWIPAAARAAGTVAIGWALGTPLGRGAAALAVLDLAAVLWLGLQTPVAVLAKVHPGQAAPLWLLPGVAAALALLVGSAVSSRQVGA